jgi:hypothetical protein
MINEEDLVLRLVDAASMWGWGCRARRDEDTPLQPYCRQAYPSEERNSQQGERFFTSPHTGGHDLARNLDNHAELRLAGFGRRFGELTGL